ncbi:unnamed protein product [Thelazia callipaeda]|uniref:ADH_zinc_N domain-containing protein n=1 Tax=Thelazia callipaeda TaxID=103827 RepID=A0A0N5CTH8_THECL|nr:unnamed protein product [Thelazia callipaeda]
MIAKSTNAAAVLITDIVDCRLAIAKEVGADEVLNVRGKSTNDAAELVKQKLGAEPDVVIECCGVQPSIELAIKSVKDGGNVILLGLGSEFVQIPILEVITKEINLRGAFKYSNTWPPAMELVRSGKVKLDKLTSAHFKLQDAPEAFKCSQKGEVIKVFVDCN